MYRWDWGSKSPSLLDLWCTSEAGITRADLYRSGPLAGVACLCDEARGRVYKGGPLPLWTTRRHHIITKEIQTQSYLAEATAVTPYGMHIAGRSGTATLGALPSRWGRRRSERACTASSSITSGACGALPSTRTVPRSDSMRTNSLASNGRGPLPSPSATESQSACRSL